MVVDASEQGRESESTSEVRDDEEARWVAGARQGDMAACGRLLDRYRDRAVRLAAHVLGRPSEAEDAAQESFIRAFRSIHSYRGDGRFYTWLYQIVLRVCIERQRRVRWRSELSFDDWREERTADPAVTGSDAKLLVEALMLQLSPVMRATLALRELDGLEYHEIAEVLGVPIGTVRSRLNSAREQFRALYEAAMRETRDV